MRLGQLYFSGAVLFWLYGACDRHGWRKVGQRRSSCRVRSSAILRNSRYVNCAEQGCSNAAGAWMRRSGLDVVAIAHAVVTQDVAVVPEFLDDGGCIHISFP